MIHTEKEIHRLKMSINLKVEIKRLSVMQR